jgi:hypothetical protein
MDKPIGFQFTLLLKAQKPKWQLWKWMENVNWEQNNGLF